LLNFQGREIKVRLTV